jgi:hypothetical protein
VALECEVLAGICLLYVVHCHTPFYRPNQVAALVCAAGRQTRKKGRHMQEWVYAHGDTQQLLCSIAHLTRANSKQPTFTYH